MEENKIEKLVFTLTNKKFANELKKDIIGVGVPADNFDVEIDKDSKECTLIINDVYEYLPAIIQMFIDEPYGLSIKEIEKLLHIQIGG